MVSVLPRNTWPTIICPTFNHRQTSASSKLGSYSKPQAQCFMFVVSRTPQDNLLIPFAPSTVAEEMGGRVGETGLPSQHSSRYRLRARLQAKDQGPQCSLGRKADWVTALL